jgi:hypothetical protein
VPLATIFHHFANRPDGQEAVTAELDAFLQTKRIVAVLFVSGAKDGGKSFGWYCPAKDGTKMVAAMRALIDESLGRALDLEEMSLGDVLLGKNGNEDVEKEVKNANREIEVTENMRKCAHIYNQRNRKISRKQLEPLVKRWCEGE